MRRSSFIFKENRAFIEEEDNPSDKFVIVEEELDGIGSLVDLPGLILIEKECGNVQVVIDRGEFTRNNNRRISQKFYKSIHVKSVTVFLEVTFIGSM